MVFRLNDNWSEIPNVEGNETRNNDYRYLNQHLTF
jgi:hypothetical protein